MAKFIIKLEKEDINTSKLGENYLINTNGVHIIFTPDALFELMNDYEKIKIESIKRIGVVAYDIKDFHKFIENIIQNSNKKPLKHYFEGRVGVVFDDVIYYRITMAIHLRGYSFDEIIKTEFAKNNKEYSNIMEFAHLNLKSKK